MRKGCVFSGFHNCEWKLKKGILFLVLSVKYKETPGLLEIFHFRYPRFLQKVELPEPTTDWLKLKQ